MASKPDIFKHAKGSYERLTSANYPAWKNSTRRLLRSIFAWNIVTATESAPIVLTQGEPEDIDLSRRLLHKYKQRQEDAAVIIYNSTSVAVRAYIDEIDDPAEMWTTLANHFNTAGTAAGRQAIFREFMGLKPIPGKPIAEWFGRLLELRNQVIGTDEAITDVMFKTHIFTSLPESFEVTAKIQQSNPNATVDIVIEALKEDEKIRSMRVNPDAGTEAFYSNRGRGRGRGDSSHSPHYRGRWCSVCRSTTHNTEDCRSRRRQGESKRSNTQEEKSGSHLAASQVECYHCGEKGHKRDNCPIKRKGDEVWERSTKRVKREANLGESEAGGGH